MCVSTINSLTQLTQHCYGAFSHTLEPFPHLFELLITCKFCRSKSCSFSETANDLHHSPRVLMYFPIPQVLPRCHVSVIPVGCQELDSITPMGPFQLGIFPDAMLCSQQFLLKQQFVCTDELFGSFLMQCLFLTIIYLKRNLL